MGCDRGDARNMSTMARLAALVVVVALSLCCSVQGTLMNNFYGTSCPDAEKIVFSTLKQLGSRDPDLYAVILRLHFHDCFVRVSTLSAAQCAAH